MQQPILAALLTALIGSLAPPAAATLAPDAPNSPPLGSNDSILDVPDVWVCLKDQIADMGLDIDISSQVFLGEKKSTFGEAAFPESEPPRLTLHPGNLAQQTEYQETLDENGFGTEATDEFTAGYMKPTVIHELLHICMGKSKKGQQSPYSCVHLAIDYTVAVKVCALVNERLQELGMGGPEPFDFCSLTLDERAKVRAMCIRIEQYRKKWESEERREIAESCINDEDTAELDELFEDDEASAEACGLMYPPMPPGGWEEGDSPIPGCEGCELTDCPGEEGDAE